MVFVLDASVALSWYFADEASPVGEAAFARLGEIPAVAPSLWWFELRNALLAGERRGRIDAPQTAEVLASVSALPIRFDDTRREEPVLALARAHGLTFYDAAYLELARRLHAPLATLDRALAAAARGAAVPLLG